MSHLGPTRAVALMDSQQSLDGTLFVSRLAFSRIPYSLIFDSAGDGSWDAGLFASAVLT